MQPNDSSAAAGIRPLPIHNGTPNAILSSGTTGRINLSISPTMSVQAFTHLLFATGRYGGFKELLAPKTYMFGQYGNGFGTLTIVDWAYRIDPDGDGPARGVTFLDSDFNFTSLRVNAVFRWEWKPGSTTSCGRRRVTTPGNW